MSDIHMNSFCFNPYFVMPHCSVGGWNVVATSSHLRHTHRRTFTSLHAARRFASKILRALDHGRQLDLRFWTTVELA